MAFSSTMLNESWVHIEVRKALMGISKIFTVKGLLPSPESLDSILSASEGDVYFTGGSAPYKVHVRGSNGWVNVGEIEDNVLTKLENFIGKEAPMDFNIPTSAWAAEENGDYHYKAEISIGGFNANDNADVIFAFKHMKTLGSAGVSAGGDAADGKVTIYAKTVPSEDLTGITVIYKSA